MAARTPEISVPDATLEPVAYKETLLRLAAGADLLQAIAKTPSSVAELTHGVDEALLTKPMEADEWSVAQVVGHLFDVDVVYGFRWRLVLTEPDPHYPGYNEKEWALLPKPPFTRLIEAWSSLREANVTLLESVESDWSRQGFHGEQGSETFEEMVRKVVGHDVAHLNQIERTLETLIDAGR